MNDSDRKIVMAKPLKIGIPSQSFPVASQLPTPSRFGEIKPCPQTLKCPTITANRLVETHRLTFGKDRAICTASVTTTLWPTH